MLRLIPRVLLIGLGLAVAFGGGLAPRSQAQAPQPGTTRPPATREQPPREAPPDQQAAYALNQAHDNLTLVSIWTASRRAKLPEDEANLAGRAEDFYRSAHKAYKDRDYPRAAGLAVAAIDASRGLLSVLHASTQLSGLPDPPEVPINRSSLGQPGGRAGTDNTPGTPKDMSRDLLRIARERIIAAEKADTGRAAVKPFLTASRAVYDRSRQAYDKGAYTRSLGLAAGAEAWTHIEDDLRRAEGSTRPGAGTGRREDVPPPADR